MAKASSQDDPISLNEKNFVLDALNNGKRIDGRGFFDYRTLRIVFGVSSGCVQVQLGQTKYAVDEYPMKFVSLAFLFTTFPFRSRCRVVATTTCEVVAPYQDRPTEGFFRFDIEFSPMASPAFESGRYVSPRTEV